MQAPISRYQAAGTHAMCDSVATGSPFPSISDSDCEHRGACAHQWVVLYLSVWCWSAASDMSVQDVQSAPQGCIIAQMSKLTAPR